MAGVNPRRWQRMNSHMYSRLPAWMTSAKNRNDVVRGLRKLRTKLDKTKFKLTEKDATVANAPAGAGKLKGAVCSHDQCHTLEREVTIVPIVRFDGDAYASGRRIEDVGRPRGIYGRSPAGPGPYHVRLRSQEVLSPR